VPFRQRSYPVPLGTPKVVDMLAFDYECTVTAVPGASGSIQIEYSTTPRAAGNPAAASWSNWPAGSVSARTSDTLESPITALRATATTAAGVLEVVG
jgi:hypothetical protein